ncbi:glycosyltransferase [Gordonia soli]|uniref:Putative glycosyltransferase n=1 Tax=Gordonia soli NBRC 108243 TaxID=1223545 RepID=M0QF87_9ACTN|nr:glycosyltransferase [Gordonia soli]GAC66961.1 putative glycosyltransferase [Gordonia soli NBRC 108243]
MHVADLRHRVVGLGSALAIVSLGLTVDNAIRLRRPDPDAPPAPEPLSVLVPMRDELTHAAGCLAGITAAADRWPGEVRIVLLDDDSQDGTRAVLDRVAHADPRVSVISGTSPPAGWLGKSWACHQLSRAAFHDGTLIFVDADVRLEPTAFVASVASLRALDLSLVSPYPRQETVGVGERLVQPLLQWSWLSTLPLLLAERSPRPSLSAANGQFLVIDAGVYRRSGGHAAVSAEVLEDIALLRAVKRVGGRGVVVDGSHLATCRMYEGWAEVRAGYRKSLWSAFGSTGDTCAVVTVLLLAYVVPFAAMLTGSRVGFVGYLAGVLSRTVAARRTGGRIWPDVAAHPASIVAFAALTADSIVARRRGTLRWKGRPVEVTG